MVRDLPDGITITRLVIVGGVSERSGRGRGSGGVSAVSRLHPLLSRGGVAYS